MTGRATLFSADIVDIQPAWGRLTVKSHKDGRISTWTMRREAWATQRICRALPYRFRAVGNGARRIVSWYPLVPSDAAGIGRFLAYCGVPGAKAVAKKIDPAAFEADAVAAIEAAGGTLPDEAMQTIGSYLPVGYVALARKLFTAGATGETIAAIHSALMERCEPENYLVWLEWHAFELAGDERVAGGNFSLLDKLVKDKTPEDRVVAAIQCVLVWEEGPGRGHTMASKGRVGNRVIKMTGCSWELFNEVIDSHRSGPGVDADRPRFDLFFPVPPEEEGGKWKPYLSRDVTSLRENTAAKGLAHLLLQRPHHRLRIPTKGLGMNAGQLAAIESIATRPLTIITGQAGTGKTAVIRAVADALGSGVAKAATTGAAAQVLDPEWGQTLHSFLGVVPGMINSQRSSKVDVLVIDETSMLDILLASPLGYFLAQAGAGTGRLVIVGDPYQIPPVGPGRVLHDLISSPATAPYVVELTEIRRTTHAPILEIARAIRSGDEPAEISAGGPVEVIPIPDDREFAARMLVTLATAYKLEDRIVITDKYAGPLGIDALNRALRDVHLGESEDPWMVGQRVVQRRTRQWAIEPEDPGDEAVEAIITNGTFGWIKALDGAAVTVVYDDGVIISWPLAMCLPAQGVIDSAYALSVHRAQGSEAPVVFVVVDPDQPGMWKDPALGYTGVTRAKERLVVFGELEVLFGAGVHQVDMRRTDLARRIVAAVERQKKAGGR